MYSIAVQSSSQLVLEDWEDELYKPLTRSKDSALPSLTPSMADNAKPSDTGHGPATASSPSAVPHPEPTPGSPSPTDSRPLRSSSNSASASAAVQPTAAQPEIKSSPTLAVPSALTDNTLIDELIQAVNKESDGADAEPGEYGPPLTDKINFFSGNPVVEVAKGFVHLFKQTLSREVIAPKSLPSQRTRTILVLAVPSWMSLADFYAFCGAFAMAIEQMRILSDSSPSRYMAVLRFKRQQEADDFYKNYNGKNFSSMSPEVCYVGFVRRVKFFQPTNGTSKLTSPCSSVLFPNDQSQVELPTCPVCLERLDSSESGLLTILCQHTFHCKCLVRWKDENSCPVCRYLQTPTGKETKCNKCGTTEGLWICLVCGHVGCSRYKDLHAFDHYKETKHNYALELETQRVWDYAGDGYVHRLIQNKTDGKLVEAPPPGQLTDDRSDRSASVQPEFESGGGFGKDTVSKGGITPTEAISLEYQYLLTAQLETQREYFEEQMQAVEKQKDFKIKTLEQQKSQLIEHASQLIKRVKQLELDMDAERKATKDQQAKVVELSEQVKDLMFYIEAQKAVGEQSGELKDGSIVVVPRPGAAENKRPKSPGTDGKKKVRKK